MANKHDLKTVYQSLSGGTEDAVVIAEVSTVSAVPTGKTRFLTYLKLDRQAIASCGSLVTALSGQIASVATASNLSSYASAVVNGKLTVTLQGCNASVESSAIAPNAALRKIIPRKPSRDNPILSVAGGSCMVFHTDNTGCTAHLFAQYYDE